MQIESLKVFCDLADAQSFTKAAEINHVTQSAVSQTISTLERHFKCLLAERSKKNFRLTREGQIVYEYSRNVMHCFAVLQERMASAQSSVLDNIRLSSIFSVGLHSLPPCLNSFAKTHAAINLQVEYRRADRVYEEILDGIADLGLVAYPSRIPKLEIIRVKNEKLVLICPPHHRFAKLKSLKPKMLNGERFLNLSPDLPTGRVIYKWLRNNHLNVQLMHDFDSVDALKRAVEIDSGVGIVPHSTVVREVANSSLSAISLEGEPTRPLAIVYRKGRFLSPGMSDFILLLKETL